mmetsp:Transcript_46404/g.110536  ORF Transcript_46404/g.110536 Transcript_46404/m.110536 type:complete len:234 (+) Transcript_46404:2382-3083(+)
MATSQSSRHAALMPVLMTKTASLVSGSLGRLALKAATASAPECATSRSLGPAEASLAQIRWRSRSLATFLAQIQPLRAATPLRWSARLRMPAVMSSWMPPSVPMLPTRSWLPSWAFATMRTPSWQQSKLLCSAQASSRRSPRSRRLSSSRLFRLSQMMTTSAQWQPTWAQPSRSGPSCHHFCTLARTAMNLATAQRACAVGVAAATRVASRERMTPAVPMISTSPRVSTMSAW